MKCGKCGGTDFETAMNECHCTNCGAHVDAEVAAALHAGFPAEEDADGDS